MHKYRIANNLAECISGSKKHIYSMPKLNVLVYLIVQEKLLFELRID